MFSQQRLSMIRFYAYFALLASALVIGAGVLNGVSYFTFAVCRFFEPFSRSATNVCIGRNCVGMRCAGN